MKKIRTKIGLRNNLPMRILSSLGLVSLISMAQAQTPPVDFCPRGNIIIVDGIPECQQIDTLFQLIRDIEISDLRNNPIQSGSEGDTEALRHLPNASAAALEISKNQNLAFLNRHKALGAKPLPEKDRLNFDLLGFVLNQRVLLDSFDTARIPFTNDSGFFNELSYILRQTRFNTPSDYEAYAARLTELPRYFGEHKTNMRRGIKSGYTASVEIMPPILSLIKSYAQSEATAHPFYQPFSTFPNTISTEEQARLQALGEAAITNAVLPAYKSLHKFFETEYAPQARIAPGIGTTPEGREYYKALVKYYTTLDMSPDEVHQIGLEEVARIRKEMDVIISELGFEGSFSDFLEFLRTDPQFYAQTPEELLKEAAWISKQIDGKMPEFFGNLPRLSYGVIPVPEDLAPNYTTGRYWNGNPTQGRAGNYVVNTYDLSQRPLYTLPALTAHEGVPGHHPQISLAQELTNVPKFRQSLYPNAFGEGWGLYAEKLAIEMGIYKTPYDNFGRLTYEMWRACRLVVDTGMHWKGWTREQAEACFYENSALSPHNIKTEVERYISWPGQALSYKIGELKILELRKKAESRLGEKFSIRKFHDAILSDGGMPLDILETKINRWIALEASKS